MKLNLLMSYFQSKSYNCTAAQLLNPFRTHFKEFQFLAFSTHLMCLTVKMRFQPENNFSLKMKIFKS